MAFDILVAGLGLACVVAAAMVVGLFAAVVDLKKRPSAVLAEWRQLLEKAMRTPQVSWLRFVLFATLVAAAWVYGKSFTYWEAVYFDGGYNYPVEEHVFPVEVFSYMFTLHVAVSFPLVVATAVNTVLAVIVAANLPGIVAHGFRGTWRIVKIVVGGGLWLCSVPLSVCAWWLEGVGSAFVAMFVPGFTVDDNVRNIIVGIVQTEMKRQGAVTEERVREIVHAEVENSTTAHALGDTLVQILTDRGYLKRRVSVAAPVPVAGDIPDPAASGILDLAASRRRS